MSITIQEVNIKDIPTTARRGPYPSEERQAIERALACLDASKAIVLPYTNHRECMSVRQKAVEASRVLGIKVKCSARHGSLYIWREA